MKEGKGLEPSASLRGPSGRPGLRRYHRDTFGHKVAKCPACGRVVGVRLDGDLRQHRVAAYSQTICPRPVQEAPEPPPAPKPTPRRLIPLGNPTKPLCHSCGWPDHLPWCTYGMIQAVPG